MLLIYQARRQGGACALPFSTEIYEQQYEYRCPQGSHQPNLRSLATHYPNMMQVRALTYSST